MSDSTAIAICIYLIMVVPAVLFMAVWAAWIGRDA